MAADRRPRLAGRTVAVRPAAAVKRNHAEFPMEHR